MTKSGTCPQVGLLSMNWAGAKLIRAFCAEDSQRNPKLIEYCEAEIKLMCQELHRADQFRQKLDLLQPAAAANPEKSVANGYRYKLFLHNVCAQRAMCPGTVGAEVSFPCFWQDSLSGAAPQCAARNKNWLALRDAVVTRKRE